MNNRFEEKEFHQEGLNLSLWKSIGKLLLEHKRDLYLMFLVITIVAVCDVLFPILNKTAIDSFVVLKQPQDKLWQFGLIYFLAVTIQSISVYFFIKQAGKVEMAFAYNVRKKAFLKLQELSFSYFDKTPVGWIMARMTSDIGRLSEILSWGLMDMVWGFATMILVTVVMFVIDIKMALLVLFVVPIIAYISYWFQVKILKSYRDIRKVNSEITASFSEGISGVQTTKTLVLEEKHLFDFKKLTESMRSKSIKAAILSSIFMPIVMLLSSLAVANLLWLGGQQVIIGTMEFGTLMMFTQFANLFYDPLKQIARLLAELQMAQASAERVLSLLQQQPEIVDRPEVIAKYGDLMHPKVEAYPPLKGDIVFKDVSFYYNKEEPILDNFNLTVQAGQTIALVGETGSGKSTLVNLICRFYEPISGEILIDGLDYRNYSMGWLHSNLGYVLQAPHLFSGSVKENIRYGKLDASDEEIIEAAKSVNAHDFIMRLEKGYDTEVGEGGGRLSTGEKQLISFARAMIRKPAIFILDEATSSIDTETEQVIQDTIQKILKGRTSFVVAHRLSTIVNADRILVIKKGKIIEEGTHLSLLKQKGYYYRLYTNQFQQQQQQTLLK